MNKKKMAIATAVASCITLSATFTGCSLVSTISKADMEQVVAEINISASDKFDKEFGASGINKYKDAVASTSVLKRELVSYFLNVGYQYVQNQTYTYEQTFNLLMDALVENAVLVQYSTMRLLEAKAQESGSTVASVVEAFTDPNKTESQKYEYLLGEDSDEVKYAKYRLYSSLNSAIDNYEKTFIDDDDEYTGTDTRTTPTNLDTEQENYYPKTEDGKLDYCVYTGYGKYLLADSGIYQDDALEGTTRATRVKAYNSFINSLRRNNLIDTDSEADKLTDVLSLAYVETEYVSQLESRIINKYYDMYEEEQVQKLRTDNYIENVYNEMLSDQIEKYDTASAFETAMGSMSDSSFILYSPDTSDSDKFDGTNNGKFGFVYNILLPFNAKQSARLAELNSIKSADEDDKYFYIERNKLLKEIKTEDQRAAWFNGEHNYSFKASENNIKPYGGSDYLFFENNLTDSGECGRYEKLKAYDGRYSYNGQVLENEDGSFTLVGNKLDIDGMLAEFSAYINFVISDGATSSNNNGVVRFDNNYNPETRKNTAFFEQTDFFKKNAEGEDEVDYSKFVYASGKVNFTNNKSDLMNSATEQYKAMSAVNELQFAYTTDTSVLSQYVGYSVSAYDTNYIKEFEYAAKKAVAGGEGTFTVCAGDYGWHLIYVTFAFDKDNTYTPDWTNNIDKKGTFENLFFEWVKDKNLPDVSTTRKDKIVSDFNKDSTVTKYQKRYQELLDLGK